MVQYTKIQSNGNNFLLLDNRKLKMPVKHLITLTQRDCNVKTGVGADGILVIDPSEKEDFKMRIFNSDGSEGEMCGNGARCIARYAFDHDIAGDEMQFETLSGPIHASIQKDGVQIGFGSVDVRDGLVEKTIVIDNEEIRYRFLTVGVPHVVVFMEENRNYTRDEMQQIGFAFDHNHEQFENGTNVNFVKQLEDSHIEVITYERGVEAITDSCGTGSSASAAVSLFYYQITSPIEVVNPGGVNVVFLLESARERGIYEIKLKGVPHYVAQIVCPDLDEKCTF